MYLAEHNEDLFTTHVTDHCPVYQVQVQHSPLCSLLGPKFGFLLFFRSWIHTAFNEKKESGTRTVAVLGKFEHNVSKVSQ